jgi:ABC-2 type transport system permease protein
MNAQSLAIPSARPASGAAHTLRIYLLEAKYEFLKALRLPGFSIPTLGFPLVFYALFGLGFSGRWAVGTMGIATYLLATYGAFGVIGAALFGFGVAVAMERGQGWMLQKRATPMPILALFAAKLAMSLLFSLVIVLELGIFGVLFGGVSLPLGTWLSLGGVLVAGAVPFAALGLAIGYTCGPNSAPAVTNLIYLPMGFLSGLWLPVDFLPKMVQGVAYVLPGYHFGQLALGTLGAGRPESAAMHVAVLAGFTVLFLGIAIRGYRNDEDRTYG